MTKKEIVKLNKVEDPVVKLLKKIHKSIEANNKALKRLSKRQSGCNAHRDDEENVNRDSTYCCRKCNCRCKGGGKRQDTYEKYSGKESGESFGI